MTDSSKYGRYANYFYEVQPREEKLGDWGISPFAYLNGESDLPGATYNVGFQVIKKPVELQTEPHFHEQEQYHVFGGTKLPNVFDFDAEIEFYMGDDPDNMEKIVITKPTIIRVPRGVWHCPLSFKKVEKPVFFQAALMYGKYAAIKRGTDKDGKAVLIYNINEVK
jgi:hypothetical protein